MVLLCKLGWPGPHGAQLTPASCAGTEGVLPHQAPTVLLVCIFLKTSNVESLFMCITVISICHLWRNAHVRDQIVLLSSYRHPFCVLCDWQLSHPSPCLPTVPPPVPRTDPTCPVLLLLAVHLLSNLRNHSLDTVM